MIQRKQVNPDMRMAAVELAKRNNLHYMNLTDGVNMKEAWLIGLSIGIFSAALIGGFGVGWLLALMLERPEQSLPMSMVGAGVLAVVVGMFELDWILSAGRPIYEAELSHDDRPQGRSFPQAANNPGRRLSITERDKELLQVFARRYPMVKTLAIGEWEGSTSPLNFDWISKRDAIIRVQRIVVGLEHGSRDGRGGVNVTAEFEERIIPNWQNGIFDVETPLPQNGQGTHVQEVAHE